jgi:hypothetical protein
LLAQLFRLSDERVGVLFFFFEPGDVFGGAVALGFQDLGTSDCFSAAGIEFHKILQRCRRVHAALPELLFYKRQVIADEINVEHRRANLQER